MLDRTLSTQACSRPNDALLRTANPPLRVKMAREALSLKDLSYLRDMKPLMRAFGRSHRVLGEILWASDGRWDEIRWKSQFVPDGDVSQFSREPEVYRPRPAFWN